MPNPSSLPVHARRGAPHLARAQSAADGPLGRLLRVRMRVQRNPRAEFVLRIALDECWYRIPESWQTSGGFRLSTVVTVGSGQLRWVPAGLRVRMRVHSQSRPSRSQPPGIRKFVLRRGLERPFRESPRGSAHHPAALGLPTRAGTFGSSSLGERRGPSRWRAVTTPVPARSCRHPTSDKTSGADAER